MQMEYILKTLNFGLYQTKLHVLIMGVNNDHLTFWHNSNIDMWVCDLNVACYNLCIRFIHLLIHFAAEYKLP